MHCKRLGLSLLGLVAVGRVAGAAPDPRVTATVLADKFVLTTSAVKVGPGQKTVDPEEIFLSPDGSQWALVTSDGNAEWVTLNGLMGPRFDKVRLGQWSSLGRNFFYVGDNNGKQVVVRDNVPSAEGTPGGTMVNGLKALDLPLGQRVYFGTSTDGGAANDAKQKWVLRSTTKPDDLNRLDDILPNKDGSSVVLSGAPLGGPDTLWRDGLSLGPATRFGLNKPIAPVWSPDGKHLAFCVDNEKKHYFLIDKQAIFNIDEEPEVKWSPTSDRVIVSSHHMTTVVFRVAVDGKATLEFNAKSPSLGKPYWTKNGAHYAFYLPRTGQLIVDGAPKAQDLHFNNSGSPLGRSRSLFESWLMPRAALSEDGMHWAATDAKKGLKGTESFVRWDGDEGASYDHITDLQWNTSGNEPIYLARAVSPADKVAALPETVTWTLVNGNEAFPLATGGNDDSVRPLTRILFPDARTARVVMLEGTRIVRYDVRVGL